MELQRAVRDVIKKVVEDFQESPFDYLYESDLQAVLFTRLFDRLREEKINISSSSRGKKDPPEHLTINPVKSEYPSGTRFDVAIVDANSSKEHLVWNHDVLVAIEIKLCQKDGTGCSVRDDLTKLAKYASGKPGFLGLSLMFCHEAPPGTGFGEPYASSLKPLEPLADRESGLELHVIGEKKSWQAYSIDLAAVM